MQVSQVVQRRIVSSGLKVSLQFGQSAGFFPVLMMMRGLLATAVAPADGVFENDVEGDEDVRSCG